MLKQNIGRRLWAMTSTVWVLALTALAAACSDAPSGPRSGALAVTIVGLPAEAGSAVTIAGPSGSGFTRALSVSDTLEGLAPGSYTVSANRISQPSGVYEATIPVQSIEIRASTQPSQVTVAYAITTGSISLNVTGLPQGVSAAITVSGPAGYYQQVTGSTTLASLTPGSYVISTASVSASNGHSYSAVPFLQTVNVLATETPRTVNARYDIATGGLEVTVTGLPAQQGASVSVTGPGGYSAALTASTTLLGLFPGTYAVVASSVTAGATYAPNPPSQNVDVPASLTPVRATVSYVEVNLPPPPQFNLSIDGMYITQAVQNYAGSVPLLAGMPGLLRVFVKASAPNTVAPTVRARIYQGSTLAETVTLLPNVPGVATTINEGTMASSWNAMIPASQVQPGLRVLVDVDPGNTIAESNENDNAFPPDGTPLAPRIEFTTPLNMTFVPVAQPSAGLTGNITNANLGDFLAFAQKVLPIRDYRLTLHEPFTTSAPAVESNNGNNAWLQILGEINALRVAEGSADYYVGIVATSYNSGVAGYAFTPGRAAVAWDRLPSAAPITAHEVAHNLGRLHAPCGGAGSPDPAYPYPLGTIGVYGYDMTTGILRSPGTSDLMGYCGYGWISDYTYVGVLDYRLSTANPALYPRVAATDAGTESFAQSAGVRKTLVVWGRMEAERLVLEPAFEASTRPVLPSRPGPFRIEGHSAQGRVLFSYAFEGEQPADVADPTARHFVFAIPLDDTLLPDVARITLMSRTGAKAERAVTALSGPTRFEATIEAPGRVQFRLDDPAVALAVIRDPVSRHILAFVRPGAQSVRVRSRLEEFDVQFSDGVRSIAHTVRAVRR